MYSILIYVYDICIPLKYNTVCRNSVNKQYIDVHIQNGRTEFDECSYIIRAKSLSIDRSTCRVADLQQ